ncbi:MAG: hypothetical protein JSW39_07645, partial [Desulfobacterales bacterium]
MTSVDAMQLENALKPLSIAAPELARRVKRGLAGKDRPVSPHLIDLLVTDTIWGLGQETSFGQAIAEGYLELIDGGHPARLQRYREEVRAAGQSGPTLGRIMAFYLAPVLKCGSERLLESFLNTVAILHEKRTYALNTLLAALSSLLKTGELEAACEYLALLATVFSHSLTFSQGQHLAYALPKAILAHGPQRRVWQILALHRLIRTDLQLADSFMVGMQKGLQLLTQDGLDRFIAQGLHKSRGNRTAGIKFLALASHTGVEAYRRMQIAVSLTEVQGSLNRYLRARTGLPLTVRPLSARLRSFSLPSMAGPLVGSDGRFLYLPDEIGRYPKRNDNSNLYKCLTRLEAAYYEFNTFDFDFEKAMERCFPHGEGGGQKIEDGDGPAPPFPYRKRRSALGCAARLSDLECFWEVFPFKPLAVDLFTIFEQARIRFQLTRHYPGLVRRSYPRLQSEAARIFEDQSPPVALFGLYAGLALGIDTKRILRLPAESERLLAKYRALFAQKMQGNTTVEISAHL